MIRIVVMLQVIELPPGFSMGKRAMARGRNEPGLRAGVGFSRQLGRSSPAQGQPVPYSIWLAFLLYTLNSLAHVFEFRGFLRADSIAERNTI
jgi:hypothetical protein